MYTMLTTTLITLSISVTTKNGLTKDRSFYRIQVGVEGGSYRVPEIDVTVSFLPEVFTVDEEEDGQEVIVGVSWNRQDQPRLGQARHSSHPYSSVYPMTSPCVPRSCSVSPTPSSVAPRQTVQGYAGPSLTCSTPGHRWGNPLPGAGLRGLTAGGGG